ncbi:right-handed parallel beta-helix repeat-containing protein [bacterium]|nr:right-handed parallel beta-helix repeat-containing protein [bacterium]
MKSLCTASLCLLVLFSSPLSAAHWYVVPNGRPQATGTKQDPFGSLAAARDAIRAVKVNGKPTEAHTVWVAGGTYWLDAPLEFLPVDSGSKEFPVIYRALDETPVVFSGGSEVTGWKPAAKGWQATLPEALRNPMPEQLIAGSHATTLAREPDEGLLSVVSVTEEVQPKQPARQTIRMSAADFAATLAKITPEEVSQVQFLAYHKWDNTRRHIDKILPEENALVTSGRQMKGHNPIDSHSQIRLENFAAALDTPGEWYASPDGTITYLPRPGEDVSKLRMIVPRLEKLLVIHGNPESGQFVEHVEFHGLRFCHSRWTTPARGFEPSQAASPVEAAVQIDGARQVVLEDCEIGHVGIYGVWLRHGCHECQVRRCWVHDTGAGGLRIGETAIHHEPNLQTGHITVDNNILCSGGRILPCAVGLWIGHSGDNVVSHNEIADYFYSGVSVGWRWGYAESLAKRNTISKNHIHHLGYGVLSDMGGIYTLGPSEGSVVSGNVLHDIYSFSYGGWGLYTDEGSSDILFENNLVYRTKSGSFHQHYGKDNIVRNNILAFALLDQLRASRPEPHRSFVFEKNIVYYDTGQLLDGQFGKVKYDSSNNCYFDASGRPVTFEGKSLAEWQKLGHEQGSIVADPKFADPQHFNFTLAKDSPALKLGFKPFSTDDVGVYGLETWRRKASQASYPPVRSE